ncbi:MAG: hypothetical protein JWL84_5556 [Rhodospirillales bacterium]|nr:hypothetical protein [Rhodospirillales bacterium]
MALGWAEELRFVVPALARKPEYDSAIIGNSICQGVSPNALEDAFGGAFVNLCMGGAPFEEQAMAFIAFRRNHPAPRTIVWILHPDTCWQDNLGTRNPDLPFPDAIYTPTLKHFELIFNHEAFVQAVDQIVEGHPFLTRFVGEIPPSQLPDSYYRSGDWDIYKTMQFDLSPAAVHRRIFGPDGISFEAGFAVSDQLPYPKIDRLAELFRSLPAATTKLMIMPPVTSHALPQEPISQQRFARCKALLSSTASSIPNLRFADFFRISPISENEANFVDSVHLLRTAIDRVMEMAANSIRTGHADCEIFAISGSDCPPNSGTH